MKKYHLLLIFLFVACSTSEKKIDTDLQDDSSKKVTSSPVETEVKDKKIIKTDEGEIEIINPNNSYQSDVLSAYKSGDAKRLENLISSKLAEKSDDLFSLNVLGAYYYKIKAIKLARMVWNKALETNKNSDTILNNIGVSYQKENEERAISFYKQALQVNSQNPYANFNLGSIFVKYKNFSMAETALETAYKKLKTTEAANNYALALRGVGNISGSLKVYERIIRSNSEHYQALLNYATLLVSENKDLTKAKDALNRARLISSDKKVLTYIRKLESRLDK